MTTDRLTADMLDMAKTAQACGLKPDEVAEGLATALVLYLIEVKRPEEIIHGMRELIATMPGLDFADHPEERRG